MGTMMRMGGVLFVSAATGLAGCGGNTSETPGADSVAAANAGAAPAGAGGPTTAADSSDRGVVADAGTTARLTDPDIVALTQAADEGEIATSQVALQKATNADVKRYAQRMVDAHTSMISERNAMVKTSNLTPAAGAKDSSAAMAKQMVSMLEAAPKGMAFDTAYVNGQAMAHQATLQMVQRAQGVAQAAPLKAMLDKAAPVVQQHLDDARALQGRLAGGAQ